MDAKQFLSEFRYIASASEGVQRLRELILSLTVYGKLVAQDPRDESALRLLRTRWAEREQLNADGKIKREKLIQQLVEEKIAFELPREWELLPLRLLGQINNGNSISSTDKALKYSKVPKGLPFIATKDVGYGRDRLVYDSGVRIPFDEPKFKIAPAKSVLICSEGGSAGRKMGITEQDVCFGNKLFALTTFNGFMPEFALVVYQSPMFFAQFRKRMTGIIGGISMRKFKEILVPVPPLAEQSRIVSKVDELLELCDKMESQQEKRVALCKLTRKAVLDDLATAKTPNNLAVGWDRAHNNFGLWLDDKDAITELRNTVDFLGCRGLLTESRPLYIDELNDAIFPLPTGWSWTTLKQLSEYITSGSRNWSKFRAPHGDIFIRTQDIKHDSLIFEDKVFVDLPGQVEGMRTLVRPGDLLMTITGANVGKCAPVPPLSQKTYVSQHVALVRVRDVRHTPFLHWWITNTYGGRKHLDRFIHGDKPGLNLSQVGSIPIPLPPQEVQDRIVKSLEHYQILFDRLATQINGARNLADSLATATVESITGIRIKGKEKMKAPKTELVSTLRVGTSPTKREQAPLTAILIQNNDELPTKTLWNASGLGIDAFYQQLKTEMAKGWIVQPEVAYMREVEAR